MVPMRLFDAINYQLEQFPKKDMLVHKENGVWHPWSTSAIGEAANQMSAGLINLGISAQDFSVEKADKIAIISGNRPEWIITDLAVQQIGAILVPIYPTTQEDELTYILKEAEVKVVFISNQMLLHKYKKVLDTIDTIEHVYSFDPTEVENWSLISEAATSDALESLETIKLGISAEHTATIIYTSGTTGNPKGVMLSHKNIVSCAMLSKESFPFPDNPELRALSFLPLNHIFEKCLSYVYLFSGISIYFAEGLETIGQNIKEVKPHIFSTVPRVLEKVYEKINKAGLGLGGAKKQAFMWAMALGQKYDNRKLKSPAYRIQLKLADKIVFSKWREALGGEVMYIITGGAACPQKLIRTFNAAKIPVFEGYGPTENSPVISVNRWPNNENYIGTVGPVIDGLQLKLAMDGEICVKGPTVMQGYYKHPELTAETIIDGWLHTGDIGTLVEGRYLKITDRKKELFKTLSGKYVAPQPIENKLKEHDIIEQCMIVGAEQKFVGVLIVPAVDALKSWMEQNNLSFTNINEAIKQSEVKKLYSQLIKKLNESLSSTEQIKRHMLLSKPWTLETGELTPKLSLRRKVVMQKYDTEIQKLFS